MNSKIVSISEDQNTITHESGFVSVFKENKNGCLDCVYPNDRCPAIIPCFKEVRIDKKDGIFIAKSEK